MYICNKPSNGAWLLDGFCLAHLFFIRLGPQKSPRKPLKDAEAGFYKYGTATTHHKVFLNPVLVFKVLQSSLKPG